MGNSSQFCTQQCNTQTIREQQELVIQQQKKAFFSGAPENIDGCPDIENTCSRTIRKTKTCLGLDKLYNFRKTEGRFNSQGFMKNSCENSGSGTGYEDDDQQMEMEFSMSPPQNNMLINYICFKKYSPKLHYSFTGLLHNSKDYKIYQVINKNSNKKRVIKVDKHTSRQKQKFQKSINLISMINDLDHPNIIRIFQVYQFKGKFNFVMEKMEGRSFQDLQGCMAVKSMKGKGVSTIDRYFDQMKVTIKQILLALSFLHDKNIAHLSVMPKNILLSNRFGSRKIMLGKLSGNCFCHRNIASQELTKLPEDQCNILFHQQDFIAPELAELGSVCQKTDIWQLGVTMFTTITNVKIFRSGQYQYKNLKQVITTAWIQMQKALKISQKKCLSLILSMTQENPKSRATAKQCLQNNWFQYFPITLTQQKLSQSQTSNQTILHSLKQTMSTQNNKKTTNFINFIQNLIIYRNINQKDMVTVQEIFYQLDLDRDGIVAVEELIQYFQKQVNIYGRGEESDDLFGFCLEMITNIDKNGSGAIDYPQFTQRLIYLFRDKHMTTQAFNEIFDFFDVNGDGYIKFDELKESLKFIDLHELEFYMNKIDRNFEGRIIRQQFINFCIAKFKQSKHKKKRNTDSIQNSLSVSRSIQFSKKQRSLQSKGVA